MDMLEKVYNPRDVEDRLYHTWEKKGYFHAAPDPQKKPFSIVIPPPNITGQLHMGHALDEMMQDVLTRFKRMQGYCTLWLPGTDHASIATEVKIVNQMAEEGLTKNDVGRAGFLERAWAWRDQYGGRIVGQLKKLGASCDWQRERFTMDEGCNKAVNEVFVRLYEKGLIYQGNRIINWCPHCKTALSDAEVEYKEEASHLWHIRYPVVDGEGYIVVATTRPETMLGDMAVAVHPEDARYSHLIGKKVHLPLTNRDIPIVADAYVEREFGTGAVKITPAHDPNDFEVAQRHDLAVMRVMNDDGTMNDLAGAYAGLDRYDARARIVQDLQQMGVMDKIEDYTHNVGHCYRCDTTVESIISKQWFVSMKPLAAPAIEAVRSGEIRFVPERFAKTYYNWMENIRDWCISRQLWWGHRIPAWYCAECGEVIVAKEAPGVCPKCGSTRLAQDEDVLDTWFSSALWPFSTMGWPEKTADLDYFYPTDVLVTGYDIIFFWVARMIFSGLEHTGKRPFHTVLVHGLVRDAQGRKMSKSLGNGIDPLEVIDKYGADALRFSLAIGNAPGNDMRFYWEKVESSRNFANKMWNAARFVLMNLDGAPASLDAVELDIADQWILHRLDSVIESVTEHLEHYELGLAAQSAYDFAWDEFCDWYIEMAKPRLYGEDEAGKQSARAVLLAVLADILKLLHPFMPFLTEEIYQHLPGMDQESIMIAAWPRVRGGFDQARAQAMGQAMELIRAVRNVRAEMGVAPSRRTTLAVRPAAIWQQLLPETQVYIQRLAYATEVRWLAPQDAEPANAVTAVSSGAQGYMPLGELVDVDKELQRLARELEKAQGEIARSQGKLANEKFVAKAPQKVVQEERDKLTQAEETLRAVRERIENLSALKG
nr:valine--tRNA ligase [Maliibacterium massiliense]